MRVVEKEGRCSGLVDSAGKWWRAMECWRVVGSGAGW